MKRLSRTVVAAIVLTLTFTIPAQAGVPRTVHWCATFRTLVS
jgi:hypothetical protein